MKKQSMLALVLFAVIMMMAGVGCGSGGGGVVLESHNTQPPAPAVSTESVKNIVDLGSKKFELTLDFSTLPAGAKFCTGQKAPNDTWIDYQVSADGKVIISNWPGGFFEFSFGTKDSANVQHWVEPVGQYVYSTGIIRDQQHFKVKLGEAVATTTQVTTPVVTTDPILKISNLGNKSYEIDIDFSALPAGTKFFKCQKAPGDTWIDYQVSADGKVVITNWPGGNIEFSFGTIDGSDVSHWADPVGKYVYPTGVVKDQMHFRVLLQ